MADVKLTLAEAARVLDPPMTVQQLRLHIKALEWLPDGHHYTGKPGNPTATYAWGRLLKLHESHVSLRHQ